MNVITSLHVLIGNPNRDMLFEKILYRLIRGWNQLLHSGQRRVISQSVPAFRLSGCCMYILCLINPRTMLPRRTNHIHSTVHDMRCLIYVRIRDFPRMSFWILCIIYCADIKFDIIVSGLQGC